MAEIVGGILAVWIVTYIWSLMILGGAEPHKRAIGTVLAAWATILLITMVSANVVWGIVVYTPGALIVAVERYFHYKKHWIDTDPETDLTETFR